MSVGWHDPHDAVEIDGPVPLHLKLDGGTPGDSATVAALVNTARVLPHARPGLRTMLDLGRVAAARTRSDALPLAQDDGYDDTNLQQ